MGSLNVRPFRRPAPFVDETIRIVEPWCVAVEIPESERRRARAEYDDLVRRGAEWNAREGVIEQGPWRTMESFPEHLPGMDVLLIDGSGRRFVGRFNGKRWLPGPRKGVRAAPIAWCLMPDMTSGMYK